MSGMELNVDNQDLSLEDLKELHRLNKESISTVKNEIRQYKQKLKMFGPEADMLEEYKFVQRPDGSNNMIDLKERLFNDIQIMQERVKETSKLTGITINHVEQHMDFSDEDPIRMINMNLDVLGRQMALSCEIEQQLSTEQESTQGSTQDDSQSVMKGQVVALDMTLEKDINDAIGDSLASVVDDYGVHKVMGLVKSYLLCLKERDQLVSKFTQAYPNHVTHSIEDNKHQLRFASQDPKHPKFVLDWSMKLNSSSRYTNSVSMTVEASSQCKALDKNGTLDSAPDMFSQMRTDLGLEKAIDSFIQVVVADPEPATDEN